MINNRHTAVNTGHNSDEGNFDLDRGQKRFRAEKNFKGTLGRPVAFTGQPFVMRLSKIPKAKRNRWPRSTKEWPESPDKYYSFTP